MDQIKKLLSALTLQQKIALGFESQKRKQEEHDRKQEQHKMKKDIHQWAVTLAEAKVYHQQTLTERLEQLAEAKSQS